MLTARIHASQALLGQFVRKVEPQQNRVSRLLVPRLQKRALRLLTASHPLPHHHVEYPVESRVVLEWMLKEQLALKERSELICSLVT